MKVRRTEPAARDLTQICDYLGEQGNPGAARRVAMAIVEMAGSLARLPERGRIGRKAGTRELILTNLPYLVIYHDRGGVLEVLRILHGAQKWP
ncbi:MAG TPA: type II toxin-antitoxin system RelE/ParE family toxin [Candidatus Acidoferrum sp.]|nr:type II toxin-antitoxin system RelE/ParE family toxin [Candidatus Acidoferrum sp.]